jgi:hypothetical protein
MEKNMKASTINESIHRATSKDGTLITARVLGQGPHVIFLPAGPGDSELSWSNVAAYLSRYCTCHLLETRGRGQSSDHPDHSPDRLVEDVLLYAQSIGDNAGVVGWGSALWARVAAKDTGAVFAVAAYEPGAGEVMDAEVVGKLWTGHEPDGSPTIVSRIHDGDIALIVNTPSGTTSGGSPRNDGYEIRRAAIQANIACITTVQGLAAAVQGIEGLIGGGVGVRSLQSWSEMLLS